MSLRARSEIGAVAQRAGDRRRRRRSRRRRPAASRRRRSPRSSSRACVGSKISRRSRSSACFTAVSRDDQLLLIGRRLRPAPTRGRAAATVPTSTLALFTRTSSCASSSADAPRVDVGARRRPGSSSALHVGGGVDEALAQPGVGDRRGWCGSIASCWRAGIDEQIAEQRLRHVQRQPRLQQRVVAVQEAVAVGVRRRPRRRCTIVPNHGSRWLEAGVRRDDVGAASPSGSGSSTAAAAGCCDCTLVLTVGLNTPRAAATRVSLICGSSRSALEIDVVVERHLHRVVDGEPQRRPASARRRLRRRADADARRPIASSAMQRGAARVRRRDRRRGRHGGARLGARRAPCACRTAAASTHRRTASRRPA